MTILRPLLSLRGLTVGNLVGHGAHDRRVAYGAIVERDTVDGGDRIEQPARLDLFDDCGKLASDMGVVDVSVRNANVIAKAALEFSGNYGCDLLRRPRWASTAREAVRGARNVEDLYGD